MNKRELDVLNILWGSENPLTSTDITDARDDLTQSTVIAVLRKLKNTGLVEEVGSTHCGTVLARTYRATNKSKEEVLQFFCSLIKDCGNILSAEEIADQMKGDSE